MVKDRVFKRDGKLEPDIMDPDTRDMIFFLEFMGKEKPEGKAKAVAVEGKPKAAIRTNAEGA